MRAFAALLFLTAACGAPARTSGTVPSQPATRAAPPPVSRAAPPPAWLAPHELVGPFPDLAALCADPDRCTGPAGPPVRVESSPSLEVALVKGADDPTGPDCALALHTARGWFVADPPLGTCGGGPKDGGDVSIQAARAQQVVAGGAPEVVVAIHTEFRAYNETHDGKGFELVNQSSGAVICSSAASPPACTPLVVTRNEQSGYLRDEDGEAFPAATWTFTLRLPGDGTAVIAASKAPGDSDSDSDSGSGSGSDSDSSDSDDGAGESFIEPPATAAGTFSLGLP